MSPGRSENGRLGQRDSQSRQADFGQSPAGFQTAGHRDAAIDQARAAVARVYADAQHFTLARQGIASCGRSLIEIEHAEKFCLSVQSPGGVKYSGIVIDRIMCRGVARRLGRGYNTGVPHRINLPEEPVLAKPDG